MASHWNSYLERLLASELTRDEHRLALALMRLLLGWNRTGDSIGDRLLRETAQLHGRSLERARAGLVRKRLIAFTPGHVGRGRRSSYTLLLESASLELGQAEKLAAPRANNRPEKTAPARLNTAGRKDRKNSLEKTAPARARIGRKEQTSGDSKTHVDIVTLATDVYLAHGGSLETDESRNALARNATALAKRGTEQRLIIAAMAALGRDRAFPGYLQQRVATLAEAGGPCSWDGADRSRLTTTQLRTCDCTLCREWLAHKAEDAAPPNRSELAKERA